MFINTNMVNKNNNEFNIKYHKICWNSGMYIKCGIDIYNFLYDIHMYLEIIKTPLLIMHGKNHEIISCNSSMDLYCKMERNYDNIGSKIELKIFDDGNDYLIGKKCRNNVIDMIYLWINSNQSI